MEPGGYKKPFLGILFFFIALGLNAQQGWKKYVALVPFWGENQDIINQFGEELFDGVGDMNDYSPLQIDMTHLPPDVPEGGFPPYICPSPSLIEGAPFAITGEVSWEKDNSQWRLRLYLWQMSDKRLIFSDDLVALNQAECRMFLPGLLDWMFSWIETPTQIALPPTQSKIVLVPEPTEPPKWLYLGMKVGGSVRVYSNLVPDTSWEGVNRNRIALYNNFHGAFHANVQFIPYLGIQAEAIYTHIFDDDFRFESWSFTFPLMLRISFRKGGLSLAALGGGYIGLPLGEILDTKNKYTYIPEEPNIGYTAGMMFGNRVGPGYIIVDLRWFSDFHYYISEPMERYFHRNAFSVSIGYEIGLFLK